MTISILILSLLNDLHYHDNRTQREGSSANYNKDVNKNNENHYCNIRGTHQSTSSHDKKENENENENENRSSHTSTNLAAIPDHYLSKITRIWTHILNAADIVCARPFIEESKLGTEDENKINYSQFSDNSASSDSLFHFYFCLNFE